MEADYKEEKKKLMVSYAKQEIIDAVIKIIDQKGVKKLTMNEVARQVGIAKGTLYIYFDNKDDLLNSAIETSLEPLTMGVEEIIDSDLSPDEKLEKIVEFQLSFFEEHKNYFRVLIYEHQRSQDPKKRFIDNKHQHFIKRISQIIKDGIDEGLFCTYDPEMLAVMFSESLIGVILQKIVRKEGSSLNDAGETIIEVFFKGIKTNK